MLRRAQRQAQAAEKVSNVLAQVHLTHTPRSSRLLLDLSPEVVSMIMCQLSYVDRSRASRLCRSWYQAAKDDIWRDISLSTRDERKRFVRPSTRQAFHRNIHRVRCLSVRHCLEIDSTFLDCEGLRELNTLELHFDSQSRTLCSLEPDQLNGDDEEQLSHLEYLLPLIHGNQNITDLTLDGNFFQLESRNVFDDRASSIFSWIKLPKLETLEISFHDGNGAEHECEWVHPRKTPLPGLECLRRLSVTNCQEPLVSVLARCPNLETLKIHSKSATSPADMLKNIARANPKLRDLSLDIPLLDDTCMALAIRACHQPRKISLSPSGTFGALAKNALLQKCETLEVLITEGNGGLDSAFVKEVLQGSSNLQVLVGFPFSRPNERAFDLRLHVDDLTGDVAPVTVLEEDHDENGVVDEGEVEEDVEEGIHLAPLACSSRLRRLAVAISGIPRGDLLDGQYEALLADHEDTASDQSILAYSWLGTFSNIRELYLGHGYRSMGSTLPDIPRRNRTIEREGQRSNHPQHDGLSFSLSSGLAMLGSGLPKLQVLDVSGINHRIGVPELEWFRENCPNLVRIDGMLDPSDCQARKDSLEAALVWIRDRPQGIGSEYE